MSEVLHIFQVRTQIPFFKFSEGLKMMDEEMTYLIFFSSSEQNHNSGKCP